MNPLFQLPLTDSDWEIGAEWYPTMRAHINGVAEQYGATPAVSVAAFSAASPGQSPTTNLEWLAYSLGGNLPHKLHLPYGWRPIRLAQEIARRGDTLLLTGPKRVAFCANLMGDMDQLTIDTHALKPFNLTQKKLTQANRDGVLVAYKYFARARGVKLAVAQAAVWVHVRGKPW